MGSREGAEARRAWKLSRRIPKGWTRKELILNADVIERLDRAFEPNIAEGKIVEAAFWFDGSGSWRRVQAIYENGVLLDCRDEVIEEFAPRISFTIPLRASAPLREPS